MVGGHDQNRAIVDSRRAKAFEQLTQERVGQPHLQQVALKTESDESLVVAPHLAIDAQHALRVLFVVVAAGNEDPRKVGKHDVQKMQRGDLLVANLADELAKVRQSPFAPRAEDTHPMVDRRCFVLLRSLTKVRPIILDGRQTRRQVRG
jgi:hypothetical protein